MFSIISGFNQQFEGQGGLGWAEMTKKGPTEFHHLGLL